MFELELILTAKGGRTRPAPQKESTRVVGFSAATRVAFLGIEAAERSLLVWN